MRDLATPVPCVLGSLDKRKVVYAYTLRTKQGPHNVIDFSGACGEPA